MEFTDKKVIITGGAKGIGKSAAEKFLAAGATVIVIDREDAVANPVSNPHHYYYFQTDVSDYQGLEKVFEIIKTKFATIDVLINNAGIQTYGTVTETSEALWDKTINVNLKSMFLCAKLCIPLMEKSNSAVIINLSSAQAFNTQKGVAAYATSKAAILGLTQSIAVDFAPQIRCIAVCPGAVMSPMLMDVINETPDPNETILETEKIHLLNRIAQPEEIADFIVFAAGSKARFMTGHSYRIDGGIGVGLGGK